MILVVPADDIPSVQKMIWEDHGLSKVRTVLPGGAHRQDSVKNGLSAVREDHDIVLIHDAVRCFISEELASAAVNGAAKFKAVTMGVPVRDTVKKVSPDGQVDQTISRDGLWLTQTPQAFKREVIQKAHDAALRDRFYGTDDAELVERLGIPVMMLQGSYGNLKITTKEDLALARIMNKRQEDRRSMLLPHRDERASGDEA
jgi:2-C-methyl-D-erythritol 4-phosphate cytidylyltransferase